MGLLYITQIACQGVSHHVIVSGMLMYHTFPDLKIDGAYDHAQHVSSYSLPDMAGKKVLDAGCASGWWSKMFSEQGASVTSVDVNLQAYEHIKGLCQMETESWHGSVFDFDKPNEFDIVFCSSLFMHCIYPMSLLSHLHRQIKPGGLIILATAHNGDNGRTVHVEDHLGREITESERKIETSNESVWWCGKEALKSMARSVGFVEPNIVGEFCLDTTEFGKSLGYHYSTPHIVLHARK